MQKTSTFMCNLVSHLEDIQHSLEPRVKCLKLIAQRLGLEAPVARECISIFLANGNEYIDSLGLLLISIQKPSANSLSMAAVPVLIQDHKNNLFVFIHRKNRLNHLYDPIIDKVIKINDIDLALMLHQVWQCFSVKFGLLTSTAQLIKALCHRFYPELIVLLMTGMFYSMLLGIMTVLASCFIADINLLKSANGLTYLFILGVVTAVGLLAFRHESLLKALTTKLVVTVMPSLWLRVLNSSPSLIKPHSTGDLTQCITDYQSAINACVPAVLNIISQGLLLLFIFIYLFLLAHSFAFGYLGAALIYLILKLFIIRNNQQHIEMGQQYQGRVVGFLNESLLQIDKIRVAKAEDIIYKKWLFHWLALKKNAEKIMQSQTAMLWLDLVLPFFLLLYLYALIYFDPQPKTAMWLQFIVCSLSFTACMHKITNHLVTLLQHNPGLKRIKILLPVILPSKLEKISSTNMQWKGALTLQNVCFTEPFTGRQLLNNINLTIRPGEFVGITGESGVGKSTLFKILLGLEPMSSGRISIDNINIEHIDSFTLRKQFGAVLQCGKLFPGTLYSNLTLNAALTLEQAWQLAGQIGLAEDIMRMPMQMHTYISDTAGESLSGGQRQKILLARALAATPKILLLDEATSALDAASQELIHQYLQSLNITRIVIAHRQSTLRAVDKLYRLENGHVILI